MCGELPCKPRRRDAASRLGAVAPRLASGVGGFNCPMDGATDEVRKADRSRASGPPSPGERRSTNGPAIGEGPRRPATPYAFGTSGI